jgi:hypothetical protein
MYEFTCSLGIFSKLRHFSRFLIEGQQGAVLHTGDFRAEPWFLESITHNPFLQPYLASGDSQPGDPNSALEAIYLDTASVMSSASVPTKVFFLLQQPKSF